jgi:hypothetical protein
MSLLTLTLPEPKVLISKSVADAVTSITLVEICKSPVTILPWYTTALAPDGSKLIVLFVLEIVLPRIVNSAMSAWSVTSKSVVRVVPLIPNW